MEFKEKIYLLYSSLQKSIRWGEINAARYFAREIVKEGQPGAVLNRLTIIAAEDVGLADPSLVRYVNERNEDFENWEKETGHKRSKAFEYPEAWAIIDRAVIAASLCCKSRLVDMCIYVTLYGIYRNETFGHNLEEYQERFLDAVRCEDEGRALYYAYIIREIFDSDNGMLAIIKDVKEKRNTELIDEWIKVYEKSSNDDTRRLLFTGIVSLLFREINYEHGEYLGLIDRHLAEPIREAAIPDRAHDMHTMTGRKRGRGLEHFLGEAATLRNERFPDDWEDRGREALFALKRMGLMKVPKVINAIKEKRKKRKKQ